MNELQSLKQLRQIAPRAELDASVLRRMRNVFDAERAQNSVTQQRASRRVEDLALAVLVSALVVYVAPIAALMLLRLVGAAG